MSPKHSDTGHGWIKREFKEIRKMIRESNAAKKLQAATIGRGGLTIKDGGRVTGRYPSGRVAFEFGQINSSGAGLAGDSSYGFRIVKDEDSDGITTNALAEIFESPSVGKVTRFFGADYFTASAEFGAIVMSGDASVGVFDGSGVSLDGATSGVYLSYTNTANAANCYIDPSDGRIWRSTSSRRYKRDIEDATVDPALVLQMQARTWRDKGDVDRGTKAQRRYVGFIAEELHDLGLTDFVEYEPFWACRGCDVGGEDYPARGRDEKQDHPAALHEAETGHATRKGRRPDSIAYDRLSVALLAVMKDQDARLRALESADEGPAEA